MTVDLFEGKNLGQVVQNIIALKRAKGFGFEKKSPQMISTSTVTSAKDQSTDAKGQESFVSREPTQVTSESEVSRVGPGKVSGRHANDTAMKCPVCTNFITSGAVNALGKSWHPNCFTCKKCGVKLSTSKYYEHNDQAYCTKCILIVKPQTSVKGSTNDSLAQQKGFHF